MIRHIGKQAILDDQSTGGVKMTRHIGKQAILDEKGREEVPPQFYMLKDLATETELKMEKQRRNNGGPDLEELIRRFLNRRGLAEGTRQYYENIMSNLLWFSKKEDWPNPREINREHYRDFINYVASVNRRWPYGKRMSYKQASPATVFHYGKVVKTLFSWAEREEYIDKNPLERVKMEKAHYKEVRPYTDEEVVIMLKSCDEEARTGFRYLGIRNKAIISMFVSTGMRLEELARIQLDDFDSRLQQVRVLGKGSKQRLLPINGECRKALRHYLDIRQPGGNALWKRDDGGELAGRAIQVMISRIKRRNGLSNEGNVHRFRHYFATKYLEAGGDINSLRLLLGHATLSMVLRYSQFIQVDRALSEHYKFNPLDRLYSRRTSRRREGYADIIHSH